MERDLCGTEWETVTEGFVVTFSVTISPVAFKAGFGKEGVAAAGSSPLLQMQDTKERRCKLLLQLLTPPYVFSECVGSFDKAVKYSR